MPRTIRQIRIEGNVAFIPLTKGYEAIIDVADVLLVSDRNWQAFVRTRKDGTIRTVYASGSEPLIGGGQRRILMHRIVAGTPDDMDTDHRDGNGLNNQQSNLRHATKIQNGCNQRTSTRNTSGVKGVYWRKREKMWGSHITCGGYRKELGLFATIEDAAVAYAKASAEIHGEFGRLA